VSLEEGVFEIVGSDDTYHEYTSSENAKPFDGREKIITALNKIAKNKTK
jgi:hypothetical protein